MSTWYSKHVEENIWRINNIKCITLVFCMVTVADVKMHVKVISIVVLGLCERWQGREYCENGFKSHSLSLHILKDFYHLSS